MGSSLDDPTPEALQAARQAYLKKWFYRTDGKNAIRGAEAIRRILEQKQPRPRLPFDLSGIRRGFKLRLLQLINEPSHAKPQNILKRVFRGERARMSIRHRDYLKAIRPSDVRRAREALAKLDPDTP
jgi:hypothetical protein